MSIHEGRQGKHIKGHNNYTGGSYVLDGVDLEALVNEYAGTGQIRRDSRGEWINKQFFNHSRNVGVNINPETKTESLTSYFSIEYSKSKGVHIIPRKGGLK